MEAEDIKGIRQHELRGFGAVSLAPLLLRANRNVEFCGSMHAIHLAEKGRANRLQATAFVEHKPQFIWAVGDTLIACCDHLLRDRMRLLAVVDCDGKVV